MLRFGESVRPREMTASPKSPASALKPRRNRGDASEPRLSRTRRPDALSAEDWQTRLRPFAWIERDPVSGRDYLKLPVPQPQTAQRLAEALGSLLAGLPRR